MPFGVNVCQNFSFFFSYQVSVDFLSHKGMNDESNVWKTLNRCFYVTWLPWCCSSIGVCCWLLSNNNYVRFFLSSNIQDASIRSIVSTVVDSQHVFDVNIMIFDIITMVISSRIPKQNKKKCFQNHKLAIANPIVISMLE